MAVSRSQIKPASTTLGSAESAATPCTFVIVDDHPVVAFALKAMIESQPRWSVLGHAESLETAPGVVRSLRPQAIVLDLLFPGECGLESIRSLERHCPGAFTIVYSVQPPELYGPLCLKAGARGYINKGSPIQEVVRGFRAMVRGEHWIGAGPVDPKLAGAEGGLTLSPREAEVLELLSQGMTSREISQALCRSVKTIETHRHRLARKLGARSAADLIRLAILRSQSRPHTTDAGCVTGATGQAIQPMLGAGDFPC